MDFKTHLQTSNLLLLTAIAVCALMGLLTLFPGGLRVPARTAQNDDTSNGSSRRSDHPIVLNMLGPGPGPRPGPFRGATQELGGSGQHAAANISIRESKNSVPHNAAAASDQIAADPANGSAAQPRQRTAQSRPRIGVRTHVMTVAAESSDDGTTVAAPRTATTEPSNDANGVMPEFTGFGTELPYVYVPVTVHPVTVNVDNTGLAAELAQIHQSLQELRDGRLQSRSAAGHFDQQRLSAEPKQMTAIRQRLDNLDQSIEQLREGSTIAEQYPKPEDSNSIIIAPFQSRRSQTMIRQALRPVPAISAPADSAAPHNWTTPLQGPDMLPFENQVPSVPTESDIPAVPMDDSQDTNGSPNVLSLEGADFSEVVPTPASAQPESSMGSLEKPISENEERATALFARPSTTVFQHTYRFSSPAESASGGVQQTSMSRVSESSVEPSSMPVPTMASPGVMRRLGFATGQIKSPAPAGAGAGAGARSGMNSGTRSSSGRPVRGADGKLRPAEQSGATTFQKGMAYLQDRRWLPGFGGSAESESDYQSRSGASAAAESKTIHRATSALRFANRPAVLQ